MKILAIETSCDETAISIVDASGGIKKPVFKVLANVTLSQAKIHAHYGGVFPMLAKREHAKSLIPILKEALIKAQMLEKRTPQVFLQTTNYRLRTILEREPELLEQFLKFIPTIKKPKIDAIAVTYGPGLEPALWVGINFAKALAFLWELPIIPVNHMEGHMAMALATETRRKPQETYVIQNVRFPVLALLVSGGHTELVIAKNLLSYNIIGETRDDAAGEAFDKVARLLGLPYPGGPEISKLAATVPPNTPSPYSLPRPMLHSPNADFSFSGLKTAVLYTIKKIPKLTTTTKAFLAKEFEEAVADVIVMKTLRAAQTHKAKTVIMGGGVSANKRIRKNLTTMLKKELPLVNVLMPNPKFSTDNALMIALAAYIRITAKPKNKLGTPPSAIRAEGHLRLK